MKVGLAGFGNVGRDLAKRLNAGVIPEMQLVAVTARDLGKARAAAAAMQPQPQVVSMSELTDRCDVIVECATADSFAEIARAVMEAGKILICVSAGGVPSCPDLVELARRHGGRVRVASGAMPGLDIIRCAAEGTIRRIHLKSRIKPSSMAHEPYVLERGHDFEKRPPIEPIKIFGVFRESSG
ncbi:MAG: NAD(P)-binding domain-containing protein [Rhodospirillales bacterium]|nr:NAD(P)-binding domain-containing protein [Rhodospirillales bacterium]